MSYDPADAAYDEFVDQLYKKFRESALGDDELYDRIVDNFKESRLCDFYVDHPLITHPARDALSEAKALLNSHPRASLVLAVTASEVFLRNALLTPLLHGSFHTESSADLIVQLIVTTKDEKIFKALLQIIATYTGIDLRQFSRPGCVKPLWEEMREIQQKRNKVLHQADKASVDEARRAIHIAETLLEDLFPRAIDKLGLHFHGDIKICGSTLCRIEPGTALTTAST